MTKVQLKSQVLSLMEDNKTSKAFREAMETLLDEYTSSNKGSVVKRPKLIEINGIEYRWCNRHELYEVAHNFSEKNPRDCKLAYKHWSELGKMVNEADKAREKAIEEQNYEELPELAEALTKAKELRAGRYNIDDNKLQHNDIDGYDYGSESYTFEELPEHTVIG